MTTNTNKAIGRLNAAMIGYERIITAIIQQRLDQEEHLVNRRISRLASATPLTYYQWAVECRQRALTARPLPWEQPWRLCSYECRA